MNLVNYQYDFHLISNNLRISAKLQWMCVRGDDKRDIPIGWIGTRACEPETYGPMRSGQLSMVARTHHIPYSTFSGIPLVFLLKVLRKEPNVCSCNRLPGKKQIPHGEYHERPHPRYSGGPALFRVPSTSITALNSITVPTTYGRHDSASWCGIIEQTEVCIFSRETVIDFTDGESLKV